MAMKQVAMVFLLLCSLFLVFVSGSHHKQPEERLRECQRQCESREEQHRPQCRQECVDEYRRQQQQEQHHGGGGGGGGDTEEYPTREPTKKRYEECRKQCTKGSQERGQRFECERQCEKQRREHERDGYYMYQRREEEEEQEEQQQWQGKSPYVFEDQHFTTKLKTEHGRVRILQKFTERSNLLKGIENYRVSILEAQPQTFIVPNHWDADAVFFVARGKGSITLILENKRESSNLKFGDVFRVPAGVTAYLTNRDNKERLVLAKLLRPVSIPGEFETFFGTGGESFYEAFSRDVLAAAFNTNRDKLERIFGRQREGVIVKASEEQIRSMSHHQEGGHWPFGGSSGQTKGPYNLLNKRPTFSNDYGRLHEVDADEFSPLQDLNVAVSFANITQGSMAGPFYNSEATKISVVIDGEGEFEMACPHLSSSSEYSQSQRGRSRGRQGQGQRQGGPTYEKVRSQLRQGTVFIQPAGHPAVVVSSEKKNLMVVCFEINARNNRRFTLAGKGNVINQLEKVAKELAFGVAAREVEEVFGEQENEFFFKGPRQQRQQAGLADA